MSCFIARSAKFNKLRKRTDHYPFINSSELEITSCLTIPQAPDAQKQLISPRNLNYLGGNTRSWDRKDYFTPGEPLGYPSKQPSFFGSSSSMEFFPANFIQIFQITSTMKVNRTVTAQNIQKFDNTLTEPVPDEEEKSNIDMLNID